MMYFKLTSPLGHTVLVNMENIGPIEPMKGGDGSVLYSKYNNKDSIKVKETVEQIEFAIANRTANGYVVNVGAR